ncbi:hypothetical protein AB0I37_24785 [Micromonospora purpureochromogenes]|uniref:hypothetical protein n=1 Tax=Micromonospora purpureochromogenes TaxID=47872 RepID=UPI0033C03F5D
MSTTAPKPPTKRLLVAACLAGGTTVGMLAVTAAGHLAYDGIPHERLAVYCSATFLGGCVAVALFARYLVQKCRRNAWWDGRAACDESSAELTSLRRIQTELEVLSEAVFDLADAAGRPRAPQSRAQPQGSTYASRAAQNDTIIINRHAEPGDSDTKVQLAERKPADPVAEARAEGYAEGYVDGIARRRDAEDAAD